MTLISIFNNKNNWYINFYLYIHQFGDMINLHNCSWHPTTHIYFSVHLSFLTTFLRNASDMLCHVGGKDTPVLQSFSVWLLCQDSLIYSQHTSIYALVPWITSLICSVTELITLFIYQITQSEWMRCGCLLCQLAVVYLKFTYNLDFGS